MSDLIECHPNVMMGKPVVRGTRITVEQILESLAAGESVDQLVAAHPRLTREAVLAAIEFGARAARRCDLPSACCMKLVADEGVDKPIVDALRNSGFDVIYVAELAAGMVDAAVLSAASQTGSLLITFDKDFGELVYRQRLGSAGVVLIRLAGLAGDAKARIVTQTLRERSSDMRGAFSVICPDCCESDRAATIRDRWARPERLIQHTALLYGRKPTYTAQRASGVCWEMGPGPSFAKASEGLRSRVCRSARRVGRS
jgi:uncharacterized protein (DUF433 family)/predicted nuclease of predicted toxin-antitoxin system